MPYRIKSEVQFMRLRYLGNVTPKISGNCFLLEGDGCIEEANKVIVQDQVENKGFWRKYYSELIQARLDNKTLGKTEKELLEPIEKVAIECLKSK